MATTERLAWEYNTLFKYLNNGTHEYPTTVICTIHRKASKTPFGNETYQVEFYQSINGQRDFGPYKSIEEAKAAALAIWRLQ
jgi:hypothetical protein